MVNKMLVYIILIVFFSSCCYMGKRTIHGLPRKNISLLKGGEINFKLIDTFALYKTEIDYHYNTSLKQYFHFERIDDNYSYPNIGYIKFYSNGRLGLFVIPKSKGNNLTRDDFNPVKALMGYYSVTDNLIKTRIATIRDCSLYIDNEKGFIRDDTLKIENKTHHGTIYIKKNIPKELITGWTPDW